MKRTAANVDETSSDDERYYAMIKGVDEFAKHWRASKVNRSTDDRTAWSRCGWAGHVAAKLRENSWHEYYHMPVVCFDLLHSMLYTESEEEREMARIKALNSTPMGAIETHVKLASTLRQLFGEKRKSMVSLHSDGLLRSQFGSITISLCNTSCGRPCWKCSCTCSRRCTTFAAWNDFGEIFCEILYLFEHELESQTVPSLACQIHVLFLFFGHVCLDRRHKKPHWLVTVAPTYFKPKHTHMNKIISNNSR